MYFRENRAREAQRQTDSNSTSLMLVVIVSIFLIVNLPQALFMGLLCVCTTFGISLKLLEGIFPTAFLLANNMLVMATYPVNFGIYCFMSSSFRRTFKTLFSRFIGKLPDFTSYAHFTRLSVKRRMDCNTLEYKSDEASAYDMAVSAYGVIGVDSKDTIFL
ncbi:unnamed protein product [Gongylonema pulchrum]|uniref:G_PROTEIN_RECEP_F1_2 domain-containing protein n=1 Tax=Gongylonema pulchrum TaxID=637853 RepID=A0A183CWI0_9BILA|nr:unnamed protein product [Gongylonema pulchrum]